MKRGETGTIRHEFTKIEIVESSNIPILSVFSNCSSNTRVMMIHSLDADATHFHSHEARASASEEFPPPKHGYENKID